MAMVVTDRGVRAYPTEPIEELGALTVAHCVKVAYMLNMRAELLGIITRYLVMT
jgi:hypothetical protein